MIVITVEGGVVVDVEVKDDRGVFVSSLIEGQDYEVDDRDDH